MGAEGLSHGDKFKRAVASGMLLTGLSAGISLTQEPVASATTQLLEVSSKIPTAEQFFLSKFNSLESSINQVVQNKSSNSHTIEIQKVKPFQWNPGVLYSGKGLTFLSENKTIKMFVLAGKLTSTNGGQSHIIERVINITLYKGSPSQILNKVNPEDGELIYSSSLENHNLGRNWEVSKWGFNVSGSNTIPFSQKVGIALTSISSNATLSSVQMSSVDNLVTQAEDTISAVERGDILKAVGVVGVNTVYALRP